MRSLFAIVLFLAASNCFAVNIELGEIRGDACSRLNYDSPAPNYEPHRVWQAEPSEVHLIAETSPLTNRDYDVITQCAFQIRDSLGLPLLAAEPALANKVFGDKLISCVRNSQPNITIYEVVVRSTGPCAGRY